MFVKRLSSPLELMNPSAGSSSNTEAALAPSLVRTKPAVSTNVKRLWANSQGPSGVSVYELNADSPKVITSMSWRADVGMYLLTVGRKPNWVHSGEPSLDALPFARDGRSLYNLLGSSTGGVVEKDGRHWVFFDTKKQVPDLGVYTVLAVFAYDKYANPDLQLNYRK